MLALLLITFVQFDQVGSFTQERQSELICADHLETVYGESTLFVDGTNTYSIDEVCDLN
jgi:hypothetical protein